MSGGRGPFVTGKGASGGRVDLGRAVKRKA